MKFSSVAAIVRALNNAQIRYLTRLDPCHNAT